MSLSVASAIVDSVVAMHRANQKVSSAGEDDGGQPTLAFVGAGYWVRTRRDLDTS